MGGDEYLITRSPLAGNRLHLATWYGFQEVHSRDQFTAREIRFRFRLMDRAYFYVTYGRHDSHLLGVRFSRKVGIPSAIMDISPEGQFERIDPITPALMEGGWHEALIKFEKNICSINIDGDEVFRRPRDQENEGAVGFRGGIEDAEIDDVRIWGEGEEVFTESFRNTKKGWILFLIHFYLRLEPDLLVINLGTNGMNEELVTGLSGFLEINRSHHISTVIILEPNNSEIETTIKDKHQILRSLGARENMQAYLSDPLVAQSGALWWDFVHLTSYGHALVAEWLSLQLLPYLKA